MKKLSRTILPAILILALAGSSAFAQNHTAIIDLKRVFDSYWKTKEADSALKERAAEMDKQFKNLTDDYQKNRDTFQKLLTDANDSAVSADERLKRQKSADAKKLELAENEQAMESFHRQAAATLDEQKRRMRDKVLAEIREAVNTKAKAAGYTMVFDTAAESLNSTPVLLYTNGENDMTDEILTQLNSTAPANTAPAAKSSGNN